MDLLGVAAEDRRGGGTASSMGGMGQLLLKEDAALFRLAESTGIDFSGKTDTAERREKRRWALQNTFILDRFLTLRGDPIDFLDPIAACALPQPPESAEVLERDLALFYVTPVVAPIAGSASATTAKRKEGGNNSHNKSSGTAATSLMMRTDNVEGKGDLIVGAVMRRGAVRHVAIKSSVVAGAAARAVAEAEAAGDADAATIGLAQQGLCFFKY